MKPKPVRAGRTEAEVMAQVVEAAAMLGVTLDRRNTGAGTNQSGKTVRFGNPGDSDLTGTVPLGPNAGKRLDVEAKCEHFDPSRLRGKKREHFERQLARLRAVNEQGGVAFWTDDATEFLEILRHVLAGARVVEPGYGRPEVVYPGAETNP